MSPDFVVFFLWETKIKLKHSKRENRENREKTKIENREKTRKQKQIFFCASAWLITLSLSTNMKAEVMLSLFLLSFVCLSEAYRLQSNFSGPDFFSNFQFFTDDDPTHGVASFPCHFFSYSLSLVFTLSPIIHTILHYLHQNVTKPPLITLLRLCELYLVPRCYGFQSSALDLRRKQFCMNNKKNNLTLKK